MICVMVGFQTARWRPRNQSHWRMVKVSPFEPIGVKATCIRSPGNSNTPAYMSDRRRCPGCSVEAGRVLRTPLRWAGNEM